MASVSYLHLHDPDDDVVHPHQDQTLTLDSLPYWSHDFHFFASSSSSDPDFLPSDDVSLGPYDLLDRRENQVNFVIDLFHQRVEQSQVVIHNDPVHSGASDERVSVDMVSDPLIDSTFGVIEGNHDLGMDNLELDLALGFDLGESHESNCEFVVETLGEGDIEIDVIGDYADEDDFFVERRVSGMGSREAASTVGVEQFEDRLRIFGFGSDSEDADDARNETRTSASDMNSRYGYRTDRVNDDYDVDDDDVSVSIPLCWDALQLEERREVNEDFEWEEVDGRVDEREVLSLFVDADDDENSISLSISPVIAPEDVVSVERADGLEHLEWEVLLNANNLEASHEHDEPYFGDQDDYIRTTEYEMLFGQFAENENAFMGRPPASKSVVENLPSVVLTKEDVESSNALCAVCKDEINVGEKPKQLPCAHRYHGECIVPWLGIRNTCPVCRFELPTDDADYERRRVGRGGRGL